MALMICVVLGRYRGFVPLMLLGSLLDNVLRVVIGLSKPLVTAHTPPGALSWVLVPVLAVVLVVSLVPDPGRATAAQPSDQGGSAR
jgi:hypothetical protein